MPWGKLGVLFACAAMLAGQNHGEVTIDVQEWRTEPARHFYIQGALNGDTQFHLFLPQGEQWKGRLLQFLQGGLGGGLSGPRAGHAAYALANGAMFVESSQGHIGPTFYEEDDTPAELAYEASYAVVRYAKARAAEFYGREPEYSYLVGGSGGGFRSSGLLERFPKMYDGAVPFVGAGVLKTHWHHASLFSYYQPVLQPRVQALRDVVRPGGSGNPWDALETDAQKQAMHRILAAGHPRGILGSLARWPVAIRLMDFVRHKLDPDYFEDFWRKPGYGGAAGEFEAELVEGREGFVRQVEPERRRLTIESVSAKDDLYGYTMVFTSGKLAGQWRRIESNLGAAVVSGEVGPGVEDVQPGDRFTLNNRDFLAWRAYHRHIVDVDDPAHQEFVRAGKPTHTQRSPEAMKHLSEPDRPLGKIQGKMIALFGADDHMVWPTEGMRYHRLVERALGAKAGDQFRIHFLEKGPHGPNLAAIHKALDDLMAWVELNTPPVSGTRYSVSGVNSLSFPKTAALRGGYQPVVTLAANGKSARIEIAAGQEVAFEVVAEDPDNEVIRVEMDFDADGQFEQSQEVRGKRITARFTHRYQAAGTYFPVAQVTDSTTSNGSRAKGIQNITSVRVVVRATRR